ncbi:MAG: MBL fold metallo-hydrolase [Muribaculaceae bacterium]|nr:MBL fold metallo-hydrolase [Muribaculaceae bacterium]
MEVILLGTGTSSGVPQLMCDCEVCRSDDPRDKRMRSSALIITENGKRILIDCGPDLLRQLLQAGTPERIDAVMVTHSHYDHVAGLDELRPYTVAHEGGLPVYCSADVAADLRSRVPYCFYEKAHPGVPHLRLNIVEPGKCFAIDGDDTQIEPITVNHGRLPIFGYRMGKFAYITDCKTMPVESLAKLRGTDTLVINALRHEEHPTHMNLRQALDVIKETAPRRAILTHMSHGIGLHAQTMRSLPENVEQGYDGLRLSIQKR